MHAAWQLICSCSLWGKNNVFSHLTLLTAITMGKGLEDKNIGLK
jgi:hypothetical protein